MFETTIYKNLLETLIKVVMLKLSAYLPQGYYPFKVYMLFTGKNK